MGPSCRVTVLAQAPLGARTIPLGRNQVMRCRAQEVSDQEYDQAVTSRDEVLKRIAKAREYKAAVKKQGQSPLPHTSNSSSIQQEEHQEGNAWVASESFSSALTENEVDSVMQRFDEYASERASSETAEFLAAQTQIINQRAMASGEPQTSSSEETISQSSPEGGGIDERAFRSGSGSADEAAIWLQTVTSQNTAGSIDKGLRAEEFTERKEAARRERGVTIERAKGNIEGTRRRVYTEDGYGLAQQQDEAETALAAERASLEAEKDNDEESIDMHKPRVASWGVFPRPKNISEAYGGGRNLKPGEAVESPEDASKRAERVAKALESYRKSIGIDVEPEIELRATQLLRKGEEVMETGNLMESLEIFQQASDMVPLRSNIGGQVNLQLAICLDSMGRNEEAYVIYKRLKGHNAAGVSKTAQRMLFGFSAAENLKVSTMDFSGGGREAWEGYFDRVRANAWVAYRSSGDETIEDEASARSATAIAAAVVLLPLALCLVLVFKM